MFFMHPILSLQNQNENRKVCMLKPEDPNPRFSIANQKPFF